MSITKVAQRVGVSTVTVSRALNNPEKVSPKTLAKIRKVCRELDFTPRVIPNRIKTVCIIIPEAERSLPGDTVLINHMVPELNRGGYHVILSPMSRLDSLPDIFQRAFIAFFHEEDVDSLSKVQAFAAQNPFVAIDDFKGDITSGATLVGSDHEQGTRLAMEHFIERGHRRIGFVGSNKPSKGYASRFETYRAVLEEQGTYDEALVFRNDDRFMLEGLQRMCKLGATGIFVSQTDLPRMVLHYLRVLGKEVPEDISLIAIEFAGGEPFLYPPLTSLVQPLDKLGRLAASKVMDAIDGSVDEDTHVFTAPYDFVPRESVRSI
jgi:DNA-binding LacI/PurR family transcriptional regulator